jgi:hypothetical protein
MKTLCVFLTLIAFQNLAEARPRQYYAANTEDGTASVCFEWVDGRPVGYAQPDGYCASGNFQIEASNNGYYICVNKDRRGVPYGRPVNYGFCKP